MATACQEVVAAAIAAADLGKQYCVREQRRSFSELAYRWVRGTRRRYESFWALRHVTFAVAPSESIAIVGRNGAGKSTLLKLVGGIARASEGRVEATGRLSIQFGFGAGFHPYLTGRENAKLQGTILGLTNAEIQRRLTAIVEFGELEHAIDRPLWTYSTGMAARLGFAVASHTDFDVLLLDEALSAGDGSFLARCRERMLAFHRMGKTLVIVSHEIKPLFELCDRALWLEHGGIKQIGRAADVLAAYQRASGAVE
jgi:lipopolysaccharide transport system ATP-binding protein